MAKPCIILLLLFLFLGSCKKDASVVPAAIATGTRLQLSLDSLYLYARETYLWYDLLPDYNTFNPRQYTGSGADISNLRIELNAIASLAINPRTLHSYEYRTGYSQSLYSYIIEGNIITGRRGEVDIDGKGNDMGLGMALVNGSAVYISLVEQGSPAEAAGLARGMQVVKVNGIAAPLDIASLNDLLNGASATLTVRKQDGSITETTVNKSGYTASPVLKTCILTAGNKRSGYIALARFSNIRDAKSVLDGVFTPLAAAGISNLIVDLRYNRGGYVETAEYTANLIAPSGINGSVMFSEHFNELLAQVKAPILKTIPYLDENRQPVYVNGRKATYADVDYSVAGNTYRFSKAGGLSGIKSIVFIVSGNTASASELLINSFRPYVDVKLVGSTTYGKPVGFFGIGIDVYTVYLAQFRMLNASEQGDYYEGMSCDVTAADDVTHDFGDPEENCIAQAIQYISTGTFRINSPITVQGRQTDASRISISTVEANRFSGMVENRLKLR